MEDMLGFVGFEMGSEPMWVVLDHFEHGLNVMADDFWIDNQGWGQDGGTPGWVVKWHVFIKERNWSQAREKWTEAAENGFIQMICGGEGLRVDEFLGFPFRQNRF